MTADGDRIAAIKARQEAAGAAHREAIHAYWTAIRAEDEAREAARPPRPPRTPAEAARLADLIRRNRHAPDPR